MRDKTIRGGETSSGEESLWAISGATCIMNEWEQILRIKGRQSCWKTSNKSVDLGNSAHQPQTNIWMLRVYCEKLVEVLGSPGTGGGKLIPLCFRGCNRRTAAGLPRCRQDIGYSLNHAFVSNLEKYAENGCASGMHMAGAPAGPDTQIDGLVLSCTRVSSHTSGPWNWHIPQFLSSQENVDVRLI